MSWPKPNVMNILKPPVKLNRGRWIFFFIALVFITGIVLALLWPNKDYATQWTFWLGVISIPALIGGIAGSVRLYLYGLAQEQYEIWQEEEQHIKKNWQAWAMQSLVVLDSYYIVPNQITTKQILTDNMNLTLQINKSLSFNDDIEIHQYIESLFFSVRNVLLQLPNTQPIDITLLSSSEAFCDLDVAISHAYQTAKITQPYRLSHHICHDTHLEKLVEWIDNPQSSLQLVIINNTTSQGTAFFCAFLLMDKSAYQDLGRDIAKAEILRPMVTCDLLTGIEQMVDMQPAIQDVNQLWFANVDNKQETNIARQLAERHISPKQMYKLESLTGNQTALSYWLSLALGCDMVFETKQNNLLTAMSQNQWLFSVVTAAKRGS